MANLISAILKSNMAENAKRELIVELTILDAIRRLWSQLTARGLRWPT